MIPAFLKTDMEKKNMNKNRKYKKAIAAAMALTLGAASLFPAAANVSAAENGGTGEIAVNPDIHYQTLEGWGTSLCWWGNVIGSWGDADWNGNGRPDREEIAELAFSPEYLNLNIVRYNVGGGDKEDTSIKRIEGIVPGWTEDMTGTKDGSGAFDADAFYSKTTEEMSDAGQLWMLEQANQYRYDYAQETGQENDIINEVFSNSPPYYMTKSGTSTGGYSWDLNNLRDDCYDDFALYMARATKWIDDNLENKFGEGVSFVEPMNEPDTSYWQAGSTKQEGCIFNTGELQSWMLWEMQSALNAEEFGGSLDDIKITGTDETALWNAINSFNRLNDDVKANLDTISAHTYSGNDSERRELRDIAKSYDKGLWMSEVTKGGGSHYDGCHESMDAANTRSQSEGIMADLKYMQPTAWIAWLVADSEYECLQTNSNWGLLHAVFEEDGQPVPDYHTNLVNADGSRKDGVPGEGYWAVTKQFYTMMQYSKYLKAGYTMIDIADSNMCAAISPSGDELVIVAQNFGDDRNTTVDLSAFPGAETAELYRTSDSESCELVETQDVTDKVLDVTLPYNSVSTWVIRANDGSAVCDPDNYGTIVNADVVKPSEEWTSDLNKFSYEGSWGESADDFGGGKYTTSETGSVTFTFDGDQAMIYGTKAPEGAVVDVSVDGGEAEQISLAADNKTGDALICSTGSLGEGTHTVTISKAEGQGDRLVEINYAKVVTGTLEEKIESTETVQGIYTVSGVQPVLPDTVYAVTNLGNRIEVPVQWNLDGEDFADSTTVTGTLEGTAVQAAAQVTVVPENIQYFIDCNSPESPVYAETDAYADLLNETADQSYADGSWGYLEEYGQYNGDVNDNYDTGWYAYSGQSIQYTIPLETGTYKVSMGFKEWWNQDRPMKVSVTADGETTELGSANTWKNGNPWSEEVYELTCENAGDVTFTVAADGGPDPVLSYIRIQSILDTQALKSVLAEAAALDRSQYEEGELEALDAAVSSALPLLYQAAAGQEDLDSAAEAVRAELDALAGGEEPEEPEEVDKTSLNQVIAMAEKLEAEQAETGCYTEETWAAVQTALDAARALAADEDATQEKVDNAFLELITACNLLENAVQRVGLKAAIEGAKAILADTEGLELYTPESIEALRTALAEAEKVYAEESADQETVNAAARSLMDAVTSLVVIEQDTRLDILIQKAEELLKDSDQYTSASVENLQAALDVAKLVAEDKEASDAEINAAYNSLAEAITSLVRKADKSELKTALDKAAEILADTSKYVEESIAGLQEAADMAQAVYEKEDADTEEVGEAVKSLVNEILKARLLGDVDGNGTVDSADSSEVLKYAAETQGLDEMQSKAADVNRDGAADSTDAAEILKYAAEASDAF